MITMTNNAMYVQIFIVLCWTVPIPGGWHCLSWAWGNRALVMPLLQMSIEFECRKCKKITKQIERIITDNLPDHVKVLQCTRCGNMGVCLLEAQSWAKLSWFAFLSLFNAFLALSWFGCLFISYPQGLSTGLHNCGKRPRFMLMLDSISKMHSARQGPLGIARQCVIHLLAGLCLLLGSPGASATDIKTIQSYAGSLLTPLEFSSALVLWNKESNWNIKGRQWLTSWLVSRPQQIHGQG